MSDKGETIDRILIVEDSLEDGLLLEQSLKAGGYCTERVMRGEDAIEAVNRQIPLVVLLDVLLPGISGFEVCSKIKESPATRNVPVIILSARDAEEEIIKGLNLGADDYITKPYSHAILIARIQSVLRRANKEETPSSVSVEGLKVDFSRFEVNTDGEHVELGASEFRILQLLLTQRGKVLTRDQIIQGVHGPNYPVTGRSVDVQIVGLRKKLGSYGQMIETVRGVGYRFID